MRPNDAYKRFIDELVRMSRVSITAKLIRANGHSERNNDCDLPLDEVEQQRKSFFLRLSDADREIVAGLIEEEYSSAFHNIASFLEGRLSCDNMKISWNGEDIPASPYASMHYDYICRREGDIWPDEVE